MNRIYSLSTIKKLPEIAGIYKYSDKEGKVIYIGKAINLKRRVLSYFQHKQFLDRKRENLIGQIHSIEIIPVKSEFEALLLEAKLIKLYLPKYNVIWKDDKHYIYINITNDEFPRILYARKQDNLNSKLYGPFPSKRVIRDVLYHIRQIIPYCTAKISTKPCFYTHIGLCYPCPSYIIGCQENLKKQLTLQYKLNIKNIEKILDGKYKIVKQYLFKQMNIHALNDNFETAAIFRDRIKKLEILQTKFVTASQYIDNPEFASQSWISEMKETQKFLQKYIPIMTKLNKLEAYDISNISGKLATGSLVTFRNGVPDKSGYRRFKIKNLDRPDDFAMLTQILTRRLNHLDWDLPDLIIIDGGEPQLRAIGKLLKIKGIAIPYIGIAKQCEIIVIPVQSGFAKIKLSQDSSVLQLIQRIRDEAHRFAHNYHQKIRLNALISEFDH